MEPTRHWPAIIIRGDDVEECGERVVAEEPLLIRVGGQPMTTLMRTPGHERELVVGFFVTEGLIDSTDDIGTIAVCDDEGLGERNVVDVRLANATEPDALLRTHRRVFSSCAICGQDAIRDVRDQVEPFARPTARISAPAVRGMVSRMTDTQGLYGSTGGAHAAGLFGADGNTVVVREDIGRHNALDKSVGHALLQGLALEDNILALSGRVSYEMVAKAARAGICRVAAVGAPTSLALDLARELNMLLVCFVRDGRMTVYAPQDDWRKWLTEG